MAIRILEFNQEIYKIKKNGIFKFFFSRAIVYNSGVAHQNSNTFLLAVVAWIQGSNSKTFFSTIGSLINKVMNSSLT